MELIPRKLIFLFQFCAVILRVFSNDAEDLDRDFENLVKELERLKPQDLNGYEDKIDTFVEELASMKASHRDSGVTKNSDYDSEEYDDEGSKDYPRFVPVDEVNKNTAELPLLIGGMEKTAGGGNTGKSTVGSQTERQPKQLVRGPPLSARKNKTAHDNPALWLFSAQAPWKHVSGSNTSTTTEVMQVCKLEPQVKPNSLNVTATCSASYTSWNAKLWFQILETKGKTGIDVWAFEKADIPRVIFRNQSSGTDCMRFQNGTFHQICLRVYGFEMDPGANRACLQVGVAIFNHGVASADFGCFRWSGASARHEDPEENEVPPPVTLNSHILANDYSNTMKLDVQQSNESNDASIKSFVRTLIIGSIALLHMLA